MSVTVKAPINIAFVKYWGKRENGEKLILPTNDSFSITLSTKPFRTKTSVIFRDDLAEDVLVLNGLPSDVKNTPRIQSVLSYVRKTSPDETKDRKVYIVSENNFPTAAGMASSASGYCALAAALVQIFKSTADVSMLARLGSGSACRSVYGGFVVWHKGEKEDGSDCLATQFVDEQYWPEMQVLCAVLKGDKKDTSSTAGMQQSLKTSPLMPDRILTRVPQRMAAVSAAIKAKNFATFAEIAMAESDELQAICSTTEPRIQYATEDSYAMIRLVKAYNAKKGKPTLAYTFDAGANCFMFALKNDLPEIIAMLLQHFPTPDDHLRFHDAHLLSAIKQMQLPESLCNLIQYPKCPMEMLLQSPVGSGVEYLPDSESLIEAPQ